MSKDRPISWLYTPAPGIYIYQSLRSRKYPVKFAKLTNAMDFGVAMGCHAQRDIPSSYKMKNVMGRCALVTLGRLKIIFLELSETVKRFQISCFYPVSQ